MYYYGLEGEETYYHDNLHDFLETIEEDKTASIIVEMKTTNDKDYPRQCSREDGFFIDNSRDYCGNNNCENYAPRNGKNGICEYNRCSLRETGRKWQIIDDNNNIKKISGRTK